MADRNYGAIRTAAEFEALADRIIKSGKPFGFDIEASYNAPYYIEKGALLQYHPTWFLTGFSFTVSTDWARYVPIAHADDGNVDDPVRVARAFWKMLKTGKGVAHNLSYELKGISRWFRETLWDDPVVGEEIRQTLGKWPFLSDTMIEVWLLAKYDPFTIGKDLKNVTKAQYGHQMVHFDDLFKVEGKKAAKDKRFHLLSSYDQRVIDYACEDSLWCLALHQENYPQLADDMIFKTEMALLPVLIEMEDEGMYLDWPTIHAKAEELAVFRDAMNEEIQADLSERLGRVVDINLGSPKQLVDILFNEMGLPVKMRSEKTQQPSTSDDALKVIAKSDPIIKKILLWRTVSKLYGSYLHKYDVELNYAGTDRAYPNHNQAGALTGRLSVDHVSYQQWPKFYHYELADGRTYNLNFRDLMISPPGFRIVGYDFSQVELRILAGMAQETDLMKAFEDGVDVHKATASKMLNIPLDQVTKKDRAKGKTINFGIVYGLGPEALAEDLTSPDAPVTKEDAEKLLEQYFEAFPKLKAWIDKKVNEGREQGFVHTMFGRKFTVWEYKSPKQYIRTKGDRMCVNAPVQGGAADYMKIGMVRVNRAIKKAEQDGRIPYGAVRLITTIHDALEFYVRNDIDTQTVIDIVQPAVSFPLPGFPEILAEWHEGYQWGAVAEVLLDAEKKIKGYELEFEVPWTKEAFTWEGKTLHEVLDQYYTWEWGYFGVSGSFYKERHPEFTLPEKKVEEDMIAVAEKDVPPQSPSQPGPPPEVGDPAPEPAAPWEDHPDDSFGMEGDLSDIPLDAEAVAEAERIEKELPPWAASPEFRNGDPRRVIVTITQMPTASSWQEFKTYLSHSNGQDQVEVHTPEGVAQVKGDFLVRKEDFDSINLILGGASVEYAELEVDASSVMAGMTL